MDGQKPEIWELSDVVKRTPDNWQQLAIEGLHFEEYEVTAIALNNQPANACRVMLGKWRDGTGRGPKTWATLLQALRDIGMGELARELEAKFGIQQGTQPVAPTPVTPTTQRTVPVQGAQPTAPASVPELAIVEQPKSIELHPIGLPVEFTVKATGPADLFYLWKRTDEKPLDGGRFEGKDSPCLKIKQVKTGDEGSYKCTVSSGANQLVSTAATLTIEAPLYSSDYIDDTIFPGHDPITAPDHDTPEYAAVKTFADEVEIIIQSCNENEYYASLELIKPPSASFDRAVRLPGKLKISIGMFARYKAAIAWTEQGASCESDLRKVLRDYFLKAKAVIGVGVAYGMSSEKAKFCDVLVSQRMADYGDRPRIQDGKIISRGQVLATKDTLKNIFKDSRGWKFLCTKDRRSKVLLGEIASGSFLLDDRVMKTSINDQRAAIGGEMEGWILYTHIQKEFSDVEVIIIKAVCDYGDGTKGGEWQPTAAKAAASYAFYQLDRNPSAFKEFK